MTNLEKALEIVRGSDRSEAALEELEGLADQAESEEEASKIGDLIEAFLVDGGIESLLER